MKNRSFPASVFITGIVFLMVVVNLKDEILFVLLFVITQLLSGIAAVLLITTVLQNYKRQKFILLFFNRYDPVGVVDN